MNLLVELPFDGYPDEYLLARLQGRNNARIREWPALLNQSRPSALATEGLWRDSLRKLAWLFQQMNRTMRRQTSPVFTLFELRTLSLCLRHTSSQASAAVPDLLGDSLLAPQLKRILLEDEKPQETVAAACAWLTEQHQGFAGLSAAYADEGFQGFERELFYRYLRHTLGSRHPAVIRKVLGHYVDLHNLLALYKKLRWELDVPCDFLAGGDIAPARLEKIEQQGRLPALNRLLGRLPGGAGLSAEGLEAALWRQLTRELRRASRDADGTGRIVEFACWQFIQARNLRLLQLCPDLEQDILAAELIT